MKTVGAIFEIETVRVRILDAARASIRERLRAEGVDAKPGA